MEEQSSPFSAKFDSRFAGPPTDAPVAGVRDVLLCITDHTVDFGDAEVQAHPPVASTILQRQREVDSGPMDLGAACGSTGSPARTRNW